MAGTRTGRRSRRGRPSRRRTGERTGRVRRRPGRDRPRCCAGAAGRRGARWPSLTECRDHRTALEGIRSSDADVLVEVGLSPAEDGEPGLSHMREALGARDRGRRLEQVAGRAGRRRAPPAAREQRRQLPRRIDGDVGNAGARTADGWARRCPAAANSRRAQRHQQLHPHPDARGRVVRRRAAHRRRSSASPSPTPAPTSMEFDTASKLRSLSARCSASRWRSQRIERRGPA